MSDKESVTIAKSGNTPPLSERELQLIGWAIQSLKSGPPKVQPAPPDLATQYTN